MVDAVNLVRDVDAVNIWRVRPSQTPSAEAWPASRRREAVDKTHTLDVDHPESKGDQALPEKAIIVNDRLTTEEREILEKFERGELRPASDVDREMETARQAARNTFNKTRRGEAIPRTSP